MSFWSTLPCSNSDVLTLCLNEGKESSEVIVKLLYNDRDKLKENIMYSAGYTTKSVFLIPKKDKLEENTGNDQKNKKEAVIYTGISSQSFDTGTVSFGLFCLVWGRSNL